MHVRLKGLTFFRTPSFSRIHLLRWSLFVIKWFSCTGDRWKLAVYISTDAHLKISDKGLLPYDDLHMIRSFFNVKVPRLRIRIIVFECPSERCCYFLSYRLVSVLPLLPQAPIGFARSDFWLDFANFPINLLTKGFHSCGLPFSSLSSFGRTASLFLWNFDFLPDYVQVGTSISSSPVQKANAGLQII